MSLNHHPKQTDPYMNYPLTPLNHERFDISGCPRCDGCHMTAPNWGSNYCNACLRFVPRDKWIEA